MLAPVTTIEGWPWFEDSYFNLKFQYPPEWKVRKIDVTNYYDESELDLMGEDAAVAGPDKFKTWILEVVPPYEDVQDINRGDVGVVHSAVIIKQPDRFRGNNSHFSDVVRSKDREYESVLDPYAEDFRFNITSHVVFRNELTTSSISFGRSPDGRIAGIAAVKVLPFDYLFQAYMTMTDELGHTEDSILRFMAVVTSIQLLNSERRYEYTNYRIPVMPSEYKTPNYGL